MKDLNNKFDRDFERIWKFNLAIFIIGGVIGLGMLGFGVWVILLLLKYFGAL